MMQPAGPFSSSASPYPSPLRMSPDGAANEAGARSRGSRTPSSEPRFTATDENAYIIPLCAVFRRHLRKEGQKFTPERAQVLDAIIQMNRVFEPDELRQTMRDRGLKVSKATIYRTLRLLQEARLIEQVAISPKQVHYRVAYGEPPQDQMVCIGTGQILHFAAPELVALRKRVDEEHGWSAVGHRFQIFAVSPEAEEGDPEDAADSVAKDAADAGDDADGDD